MAIVGMVLSALVTVVALMWGRASYLMRKTAEAEAGQAKAAAEEAAQQVIAERLGWQIEAAMEPQLNHPEMKYVVIEVGSKRFIITLECPPQTDRIFHKEIVGVFVERWGIPRFKVLGGGRLRICEGMIIAYGTSGSYGPAAEQVAKPLLEAMARRERPGDQVILKPD